MPKLIQIATSSESGVPIDTETYFVTAHDNLNTTGTDIRYTAVEVVAYLSSISKSFIVPTATATSLTDDFFANTISEICMGGAAGGLVYIAGADFTQNTGKKTIQLITGQFVNGETILAKI